MFFKKGGINFGKEKRRLGSHRVRRFGRTFHPQLHCDPRRDLIGNFQ